MHAKLSAISVALIAAIGLWSSPALSEDDMMGQTDSGVTQNGMGREQPLMGQMGSADKRMGGMSQMGSVNQSAATTGQQMNPSITSDEHGKHHPGGGGTDDMSPPSQGTAVLSVPQGSLDDQLKIQEIANKRMEDGTALMTQGIVSLSSAKQKNDIRSMDQATKQIRDGLSQFQSGLSAQHALSNGLAPRETTLRWLKQQMNLQSTAATDHGDIFGVSWFHFFVMTALIAFALVMIGMYFFKMRRAAEVLGRVTQASPSNEKLQPETPAKNT
jgi:hypothetical protein